MNIIKKARLTEGLTQKEVADVLGVSIVAVCKWENGKSLPAPRRLKKIADVLHISVSSLISEWERGDADGSAS